MFIRNKNQLKKYEQEFHNNLFSRNSNLREREVGFYSICSASFTYYKQLIMNMIEQNHDLFVLEYGCGLNSLAFDLYVLGNNHHLIGIDISRVAIVAANKRKGEVIKGCSNTKSHLNFLQMDAEKLSFSDECFDLIYGSAILHHLNFEIVFDEIYRVLKVGGKAVFLEPMAHNFFINMYRRLTPASRTPGEHPFKMKDFSLLYKLFSKVDLKFFHLTSLLCIPFVRLSFIDKLVEQFDVIDDYLFSIMPFLKRYGWSVLILLEK